ncbi:MAG: GHMP kinase [Anaerolineae bacterium]|nr:hypothetical protein [Thermoflexales bacterium]MDW8407579.1 GHMP kinase [Anaerolineae bacterium]
MITHIPEAYADTVAPMRAAHEEIVNTLKQYGITFPEYPALDRPGNPRGAAAALAHPMQGVLKYHGLADWAWRIAYLPSISVCNSAGYTLTFVEFDPALSEDVAVIGGVTAAGRALERVKQSLDAVRRAAHMTTRARVISKNVVRGGKAGKGLGTSASGSAALAVAAIAAAFGAESTQNTRFVSSMARLLAGSGCRSATGGVSLWLSYPGAAPEDSFAVRLDTHNQLADMRLITVPIDSRIGLRTEQAHADAPNSPLFKCWMLNRRTEILECIDAVQAGDWQTIGRLAERDSIQLHAVTMTGGADHKIFAWEPENLTLFRACNDLRASGAPVYASTDTGPTAVLLTHRDYVERVTSHVRALGFEAIESEIGGPARLVDVEQARQELEF